MEILGERPVWSMSGGAMVSSLDATYAEIARLEAYALHLTAGLETIGHAQEIGAGTTARFLTLRYRVDPTKARRDVHLANALPRYPVVAAALPDPDPEATVDDAVESGGVLLHPAQAEAIVSALEKLPATVPVEDLVVAEREMVELGRTHGPLDLRKAGVQVRNRLACDAQILPVVLGSQSQPLDVGTTVRLATGPMRKALIARDKGCVCCGAPPIYCDAHHVRHWIDGGETRITNLVLLCKRCHRWIPGAPPPTIRIRITTPSTSLVNPRRIPMPPPQRRCGNGVPGLTRRFLTRARDRQVRRS